MATPALGTNALQAVATYQASALPYLANENCALATANTKFKNFQDMTANLGSSVLLELPARSTAAAGLVVSTFGNAAQRAQNLTMNLSANSSWSATSQQYITNSEEYIDYFTDSCVHELSEFIEASLWKGNSEVQTGTDANNNSVDIGYSGPYRAYFAPITSSGGVSSVGAITTYQQLANALVMYRNFGAGMGVPYFVIPDTAEPAIVSSGQNQFVLDRNETSAMSWEVGNFNKAKFMRSNLLPLHTSGTLGDDGATLTFVSIDVTNTVLTFTSSAVGTAVAGDIVTFAAPSGLPAVANGNLKFLTFTGHQPSAQFVQFAVSADAATSGVGNTIELTSTVPLIYDPTGLNANANLSAELTAGFTAFVMPSHRAGLIFHPDSRFVAMPRMDSQDPFPTANQYDEDTGMSVRLTYGSQFGQNTKGWILDAIWGFTNIPEYMVRVCFPTTY